MSEDAEPSEAGRPRRAGYEAGSDPVPPVTPAGAGGTGTADPQPAAAAAEDAGAAGTSPISLQDALGGKAGMLDSGLPGAVFVAVYVAVQDLRPALWAALGVGAVVAAVRVARRDPLQNAVAGFVGVAVAAVFAWRTGRAANFYLLNLLLNVGEAAAFAASLLVRWPLLGVVLGPVFGEGTAWRRDPPRRRAYTRATAVWLGMFSLRLVVLLPLYFTDHIVALGVGRLALGWPLYLLVLWISWLILKRTEPATVRPAP